MEPINVLREFLQCGYDSQSVFDKFLADRREGDVFHESETDPQRRFWYRPATRENAVLLIAHADVSWDERIVPRANACIVETETDFSNKNPNAVLGGDDRCGCALLYLFRDSGHALLVTDGEESELLGARELIKNRKDVFAEINRTCNFFIELDRRGDEHYKFYSEAFPWEFTEYIYKRTGWVEDRLPGATDIFLLCRERPGVNLTVGYHNEHSTDERVVKSEWMNTYVLLQEWLAQKELPRF